jgi:hypothetical protein
MDDLHIHDLFESLLSLNIKVLKYFYRFESLIHSLSQVEEETKILSYVTSTTNFITNLDVCIRGILVIPHFNYEFDD